MTFSAVTGRGSAVTTASATSLSMNPSANLTVNKLVIINVVTDNIATIDGISTDHTVTDSKSNSWTKIREYTETDGSANDGVTISSWYSIIATQINTTDTITITLPSAVTQKIISCFEVTRDTSLSLNIAEAGIGQADISATVTSLVPGTQYLLLGHGGAEGNDNDKVPLTGYTELFDLRTSSTLATSISQHVIYKLVTGSKSETASSLNWTQTNPMYFLIAIQEYSTSELLTITHGGVYVEQEQKLVTVEQGGIYVEQEQKLVTVEQGGIYVEEEKAGVAVTFVQVLAELLEPLERVTTVFAYAEVVDIFQLPSDDSEVGTWTNELGGTPLAPSIGEYIVSDITYVGKTSPAEDDYFEVECAEFGNISLTSNTMSIEWRAYNAGDGTITMKAQLREGTTVIAEDERTLTGTPVTYEYVLTDEEVAEITDMSNLQLRFVVTGVS